MSAKHTPGPWRVEWDFPNPVAHINGGSREGSSAWYQFASVYVMTEDEDGGESFDPIGMANARLIAAAPDLLEALEALEAIFAPVATDSTARDWIDNARAAIAKARGEA